MVNIVIGFVDAADLVSDGLANLSPRTWHWVNYTEQRSPLAASQTPPACLPSCPPAQLVTRDLHRVEKNANIPLTVPVPAPQSKPGSNNH